MNEKEICYKIYSDEFGDDEFAKELFNGCYKYCKTLKVNNDIVAIVFLLPCEIVNGDICYTAKYVFAVTTKKTERNKGYMSKLLNLVYNEKEIFFLKPVNDTLNSFYKKLGYEEFTAQKNRAGEKYVIPCEEFFALANKHTEFTGDKYTLMYRYKENINLNNLNFAYTME